MFEHFNLCFYLQVMYPSLEVIYYIEQYTTFIGPNPEDINCKLLYRTSSSMLKSIFGFVTLPFFS